MTDNLQQPKVSVVIASYNYEKYIGDAIESVIAQTYTNWELIIVDDASTDNSVDVIKRYVNEYPHKIRLIAQQENRGVGFVANLGIDNTTTDFIANLGSDDRMMPERLEKQMAYFVKYPEVGVVCSDVVVIDGEGVVLSGESVFSKPVTDLRLQLLQGNFINSPSATFRKEIHYEIGGFSPVLDYVQDFDHWLRVLDKYEIVRIDEKLTGYRVHGKNLSVSDPQNLSFAGTYETLIVILRAIFRRNQLLAEKELSKTELVFEKLNLANAARDAELRFLGELKYSVSVIYFLLLEVFELDADNEQGHHLLNEVYIAIGDRPRALGQKPITVEDYKLIQRSNSDVGSLENLVVQSRANTGVSLVTLVNSSLETKRKKFIVNYEKETFVLNVAKLAFDELVKGEKAEFDAVYLNEIKTILHSISFSDRKNDSKVLLQMISDWQLNKEYEIWRANHSLLEIDAELHALRMMKWTNQPTFHVIVVVYEGQQHLLANTIDSIAQQLYGNWKLTVIGDGAAPDSLFHEVDVLEWVSFPDGADLFEFLNSYISTHLSDWILFAPAGTQFEPHCLLKLGDFIDLQPEKVIFYVDDDEIDIENKSVNPRFKPDFNLDLLRSMDYAGVVACRHQFFKESGGFDALPSFENVGLLFKAYESVGAEGIGHIDDLLIHLPQKTDSSLDFVFKQAVQNHLDRLDIKAEVQAGLLANTNRVVYLHEEQPRVTIIIPTRDKVEYLRPCIESVLTKTAYPDYDILIVNNLSESPETLDYLTSITEHPQVTVIDYSHPFNYAAISNLAVEKARGEYIVFLNNDAEVLQENWIDRMLMHAQRPEVGAVGVRLSFPETANIQHAGVVIGMGGIVDNVFSTQVNITEAGYMNRAQVDQNYSAVTAACMMVDKRIYQKVGGMNEELFAVNYNDVDFCLTLTEQGYINVWTPYVTLTHYKSVTQNTVFAENGTVLHQRHLTAEKEVENFSVKWSKFLAGDPAYNKNLSLASSAVNIEYEMPVNWDVHFHEKKKILGLPLGGGAGQYRITQPFAALSHAAMAQCESYRFRQGARSINLAEYMRLAPDIVVFHAAVNDIQLQQIELLKQHCPDVKRVYAIDDLLTNVPEKSPVYKDVQRHFKDVQSRLRTALGNCDRMIASTQPLADLCKDLIDDIRVVPNRLKKDDWCSLQSLRNQSEKPRVGWAGAQQHHGDLEIIVEVVKALADEVDWVFMGMCPDELHPYIKEYHNFVPMEAYPQKLASLNLDLALAPLELHPFNESKSNLRLLEYGILGWPVIATDIYPYQTNNPPILRVSNDPEIWLQTIRTLLEDTNALHGAGDALKQWVLKHYILEDHLDEWMDALS
jgi:glycosyltransferase involved in cell wall biosynthesis